MNRLGHALEFARKIQSRLPHRHCFVYLVHCDGFHKVGIANDIKRRLNGIQTGNPHTVNIVRVWRCTNANAEERRIHRLLSSKGYHVRGEWFKLPNDALHDLIHSMRSREC